MISTTTPDDYLFRELVRAKNDTLYTPLMFASNDSIDYLRNGIYGRQGMSTTTGTFELASNLPIQPYRLSGGGYESEFAREVGNKQYELKDHLGNVRVVVEDIKTAFDADNDGNDDSYTPSILSFNDYYPFGQITSDRSFNANSYDYGFNGMREDNEWKGEGNSLDFGARIYSSRIGRWMSVDPKAGKQPGWSTYKAFLDAPVVYVDPDGETEYLTITIDDKRTGKSQTYTKVVSNDIFLDKNDTYLNDGLGGRWDIGRYYDKQTTYSVSINEEGHLSSITKKSNLVKENGRKAVNYLFPLAESDMWANFKQDVSDIDLTGEGGVQPGGIHFVSSGGGADPTKFVSASRTETVNIEDLLTTFGALGSNVQSIAGKVSSGDETVDWG